MMIQIFKIKTFIAISTLIAVCILGMTACDKKQSPAETNREPIHTLETENADARVQSYAANPTDIKKDKVELAFAELDQEIQELQIRVNNVTGDDRAETQRKLDDLKTRRDQLRNDFDQAKFDALKSDTRSFLDDARWNISKGLKELGDKINPDQK